MNHHPHDTLFIDSILSGLPFGVAGLVQRTYEREFQANGRQAANHYLLSVQAATAGKALLVADDDTLRRKAEKLSGYCEHHTLDKAADFLSAFSLPLPMGETDASTLARLACPVWWQRQLRKKQDREQEQLAIHLGLVRKGWQPYCSTALLNRMQERHERALEVLQGFDAVSDEGDVLPLLEVLKGSLANPAVRRAELMVRMRGFEDYATEQGHVALFYTITCPSKYHRMAGAGLNPHYDGSTPRQAQAYLCKIWQRIRAKLKYLGLNVYGFRVAEPHADATPHWHLLLFMAPEQVEAVTAILQAYALAEDGDEPGADQHRFEAVRIDASQGSATGYIAKYVSKNIDGFGLPTDKESLTPAGESAQRVRAWASVWGIRQFQQIGGAPVGVWRELRRIEQAEDELIERARQAADSANWCQYLTLQGGAEADRKAQPLRVYRTEQLDTATGAVKTNRYGEIISAAKGIEHKAVCQLETRSKVWRIQEREHSQPAEEAPVRKTGLSDLQPGITFDLLGSVLDTFSHDTPLSGPDVLQAAGRSLLPWSPVTNCREGAEHEADSRLARLERACIQLEGWEVLA
ncbi:MAG: replication endonuclease [Thiolinea sp.]